MRVCHKNKIEINISTTNTLEYAKHIIVLSEWCALTILPDSWTDIANSSHSVHTAWEIGSWISFQSTVEWLAHCLIRVNTAAV